MSAPDWLQKIQWSAPYRLSELIADPKKIPTFEGFYAFNLDPGPLQIGRVLYIGETERTGGLRARLRSYLPADPTKSKEDHSGALWIHWHRIKDSLGPDALTEPWGKISHRAKPTNDSRIYLRWSGWESDKKQRQAVETGLMQYYQAWYNKRQMKKDIDLETI
ncbi:hypothetical protein FHY55_07725 [Oceanicola sp. D3]|uniref:hypothetical protein n=1 Tax=Oceanicola sp. D3 TaxID=2587163 RepID=UPI001123A9A3|nr:hypothetical protein [Oceanicola sp. D3]QDC09135.1 hypothetical protein FHY55_07725 [Oceanicola sp. D3]